MVTQSWENVIHRILLEALRSGAGNDPECLARMVAWATLRAYSEHPEWGQAQFCAMPRSVIIDRMAAMLVNGTPIERMAV